VALAALLAAAAGLAQSGPAKRANELTLAGLRPGRSTLEDAQKRFARAERAPAGEETARAIWWDTCWGHEAAVEYDANGILQTVTVSVMAPQVGDCTGDGWLNGPLGLNRLRTGRGLVLGQHRGRVTGLYGPPQSEGPAALAGRDAEFLYYAFDWAGSDVPQVLEVTCDAATGRVVKILLAYPSL
jgi:hypothetical protein